MMSWSAWRRPWRPRQRRCWSASPVFPPPTVRRSSPSSAAWLRTTRVSNERPREAGAAQAASFMEIIQEAQELERAAGRPVDPNMTVGGALEILGR